MVVQIYRKINGVLVPVESAVFTGADTTTAGTAGIVPAPSALGTNSSNIFLNADGTWKQVIFPEINLTPYATTASLNSYLPLAGGTITGTIVSGIGNPLYRSINTSFLRISGGNAANVGAALLLYGGQTTDYAGWFYLVAKSGATDSGTGVTVSQLRGKPTGELEWNAASAGWKSLEIVSASSYAATSGYIRYKNGMQIVWGQQTSVSAQATVTYSVAFSHTPIVLLTPNANTTSWCTGLGTTSFKINLSSYSNSTAVRWIAIGDWA